MRELIPYILSGGMALISGLCGICVKILWRLADNVAELNQKMAIIVTEMSHGTRRLDNVEDEQVLLSQRILLLEQKF